MFVQLTESSNHTRPSHRRQCLWSCVPSEMFLRHPSWNPRRRDACASLSQSGWIATNRLSVLPEPRMSCASRHPAASTYFQALRSAPGNQHSLRAPTGPSPRRSTTNQSCGKRESHSNTEQGTFRFLKTTRPHITNMGFVSHSFRTGLAGHHHLLHKLKMFFAKSMSKAWQVRVCVSINNFEQVSQNNQVKISINNLRIYQLLEHFWRQCSFNNICKSLFFEKLGIPRNIFCLDRIILELAIQSPRSLCTW